MGSEFTVTFTVPVDTAFSLATSVSDASVSLTGPGVNIVETGGTNRHFGTLLAGQTYTCQAIVSAWGFNLNTHTADLQLWLPARALSGFVYQGTLGQNGQAISSPTDMRFALYRGAASPERIGQEIAVDAVAVEKGVFTQALDFGDVFDGSERWLEIRARNPAGSGGFVTLSPRVRIASVPLASRAGSAGHADDADMLSGRAPSFYTNAGNLNAGVLPDARLSGSVALVNKANSFGPFTQSFAGAVGIGRSNPAVNLDVAGRIRADAEGAQQVTIRNGNSLDGSGAEPAEIFFDRTALDASAVGAVGYAPNRGVFLWNNGQDRVNVLGNGNVGIGTSNPTQRLQVIGNIQATGMITPSCAKLKENVEPMRDALERLSRLDAVRFDWKPDEARTRGFTHDLGFIAEDVAQVFPEIVFRDEKGSVIGLDYARMSAVAVGAIKQLKADNEKMRAENTELRARLDRIEAMLAERNGAAAGGK